MTHENKTFENVPLSSKESMDGWFRIVAHRPNDNKSFLEGNRDEFKNNRTKHNYVLYDLSDAKLRELRDMLNSLEL